MSNRGFKLFRLLVVFFVASILWACSGDDGAAGPAGAPGPAGTPGGPGPTGSAGGVPIDSADKINIEVSSVSIPSGGGAPVVELKLTNDLNQGLVGLPASDIRFVLAQLSPAAPGSGGSSAWQSYVSRSFNNSQPPPATVLQANTETATAGVFVDNNDGTYQYTYANALSDYPNAPTFDATKTHRIGVEIRGQAPISTNGILDFVPAGGAPLFERKIVDNDTCDACHDRLEFHGGPRTDVEYCVTCHNPYSVDPDTGNSVDFKVLIHNIHAGRDGYQIQGYGGTVYDFSDVVWTQDIRNCQTCHEISDANTPQASHYLEYPTREACGTCHYDDGNPATTDDYAIEDGVHPGGFLFDNDEQCASCHGPNATVNGGDVRIAKAHELKEVIAAEAFAYEVVSVTNTAPGQIPNATIRVFNPQDGTTYDINDPAGPFQIGSSRLNLDLSWTTTALGNVDPNDTLARPASSGAPFAPIQINFQTGAVADANGNFTKAAPAAIPTGIAGSGLAVLEGRGAIDIDGSLDNLPVSSATLTFAITDASPTARRKIVDIAKCNDCHKNLALHGDNRSGNTEVCSTCHNPNA
ncbi:MAG: OmcA/MtrC family decaheme c-type cytochrome, partial [Woeseia sp.]